MRALFDGIPLDQVSTSMTVNSPAAILLAFYVCVAEDQGVSRDRLRGTVQTDILKEYIAQKEYIYPPEPSMRLVTDMVEFCAREMPLWNPISISGYHIREAGSTAAQELAFTLADGFAYVDWASSAASTSTTSLRACRSSSTRTTTSSRRSRSTGRPAESGPVSCATATARRIQRRWLMRFHTQTAGVSLTAQQPEMNIVRDRGPGARGRARRDAVAPHEQLRRGARAADGASGAMALRTQQMIAHETGVVNTADPLGGSYFVEHLTNELERQAYEYFERIEQLGGVVEAIKRNFFQTEIAEASFRQQREVELGERVVVGVNSYQADENGATADPPDRPGRRATADRGRPGVPSAPGRRRRRGGALSSPRGRLLLSEPHARRSSTQPGPA